MASLILSRVNLGLCLYFIFTGAAVAEGAISRQDCLRAIHNKNQRPFDDSSLKSIKAEYMTNCASLPGAIDWPELCKKRLSVARALGRFAAAKSIEKKCLAQKSQEIENDLGGFECLVKGCWREKGDLICHADTMATGIFGLVACKTAGALYGCLSRPVSHNRRFPGLVAWRHGDQKGTIICNKLWL